MTTMQSPNLSVLCRVEQANGRTASARLAPSGDKAKLIWYSGGDVVGSEEFEDMASAMNRAEELRVLVKIGGF